MILRIIKLLALAALATAFGITSAVAASPAKPNIVYVLADDLGWKDVGFRGSDIRTPNLDELARGGAVFEQFYSQPFCTPARAALMTGRYPHRYGLQTAVIPSAGKYGLATDEWLLPQALKDAGYRTAIVGKWHLGHADPKYWPRQRGFDYQYGPLLGEIDYYTHAAHGKVDWFRNNKLVKEPGYATELLGNDAVRVIEKHDTRNPLFLYLAFTSPHAPYQAPQAYVDQYKSIADANRRTYAAMITAMDAQIGRVVKALEARGMRDNTLIVFHSDNGGPRSAKFTGEIDMSHATIPADNGPFRDGKGMLYEGGTRVVALANWPGQIPAGTMVDTPVQVVDMYPTLAALADAPTVKAKPLDGMNVWPAIAQGQPSPRTEVVYDIEPFRAALRDGNWKLVWKATLPSQVELYDLAKDPGETTNLAEQDPQRVAAMKKRIQALATEAVPPLLFKEAMGAAWAGLASSVSLPEDDKALDATP